MPRRGISILLTVAIVLGILVLGIWTGAGRNMSNGSLVGGTLS